VEIRLRRTRFDLVAALQLIVYAAVFTALVWVATAVLDLGDTVLTVVLVVLVVLWLLTSVGYVLVWNRMRRIESPLALHAYGVFARSQYGELTAPWETVRSATIERVWSGRQLRILLVPPDDPRHGDLVDRVDPRMMKVVDTRGMRFSLRILDIGVEELRQAFTVQSGGRIRVG
jgi:hypothetical protein